MLRTLILSVAAAAMLQAADKQILLIAGPPSHGRLEHEQNAAAYLLADCLNKQKGIHATVSKDGWPANEAAIDTADAIFFFFDGGVSHLAFTGDHAAAVRKAAARGAGLMFYHYAVEPSPANGPELGEWIGGYFELNYSVNPIWEADFQTLPNHPIANGVKPFKLKDEWYFNMKFPKHVQSILMAIPPPSTMDRPDGIRSGNADVRSKIGKPQVVMWAFQRPGGNRGVGFTGGHYHVNLGNDNFCKLVLNALLWVAKAKVPANGVECSVTQEDLMRNLDPKPR